MITRHTLLERVRDRLDEKSWEDFIEIYRPYIYYFVRRMNIAHEEAEDITQNTLVKLWDKLPEFKHSFRTGAFRSWLCKIVKNQTINIINRQKNLSEKLKQMAVTIEQTSSNEMERMAKEEWNSYISNLAWKEVEQEFDENAREAFLMSMKNISAEEIAEKLGINYKSVYVLKKRIKDRMKEKIKILQDQYL